MGFCNDCQVGPTGKITFCAPCANRIVGDQRRVIQRLNFLHDQDHKLADRWQRERDELDEAYTKQLAHTEVVRDAHLICIVRLDAEVATLRAERDQYREACAVMHDFWTNPESEASVPLILNLVEAAMKQHGGPQPPRPWPPMAPWPGEQP